MIDNNKKANSFCSEVINRCRKSIWIGQYLDFIWPLTAAVYQKRKHLSNTM